MIPKTIHYCWLSNDPIPEEFQKYIKGWHDILKGYEFIKWDFSRFPKNSSIWVQEAFDNKKYAFAADYIRLYAVYNYGGIYMDMDIEVLKAFDELLDAPYMFAKERASDPWIEAGCFGAEKGNEFVGKCLDRYKDRHFTKNDGSFDQLPLPQIMEKVRNENKISLQLYPWTYFTAKSYDTGIECPTGETYAIHHFAGSWKTTEEIKVIEATQKYSRIFGHRVGHNIAEFQAKAKCEGFRGIVQLTKEKLARKIGGGVQESSNSAVLSLRRHAWMFAA